MILSVCIITYNHEKFITQAIESVLSQKTNFDFNIIIGEDCSTDSTRVLCEKFKNENKIQLLLNNTNLGMMGNFIHTLKNCNGNYIAICEGDDYWIDPFKLQKQVDFLNQNPECSMVITDRLVENNKGLKWKDTFYNKNKYTIEDIVKGFVPPTQTIMFRNNKSYIEFLSKNSTNSSGGDRLLGFYCSLLGYIYRIEEITAVYRITGLGVWSSETNFQKLVSNYNYLKEFHCAIGIPVDNIYLKQYAFDIIVNILFYTIKRPRLIFKNFKLTFNIYKEIAWSNQLILLIKAIYKKIKSLFEN